MKRRGFFASLAKAAAIVALAPQLAFRAKPELPAINPAWETAQFEIRFVSFVQRIDSETGVPCENMFASWIKMPIDHREICENGPSSGLAEIRYELRDGKFQRT